METQFNIIANELEYLENHSDESNLHLASEKLLWSSCQQSVTSHFNTKRHTEASLDTQNCSHVMSCQTINLIKYKEPWKVNIIISREVEIIAH